MKFNKIYLLAGVAFSVLVANTEIKAQDLDDYDDVFEIVKASSKEKAYYTLMEFQKIDPKHANAYFQLGLINLEWTKTADPLTNYSEAKQLIYNTKLYFGLSKLYLDEKEVRKNREFYTGVQPLPGKKVELQNVTAFIEDKLAEIGRIEANYIAINSAYDATVRHYSNCSRIFKQMNERNNKIKDIYLTADEELLKNADDMKLSFDSTLLYFDKYSKAIAAYPIKNYKQTYKLQDIETFRLEGLNDASFLDNNIALWNYGKWVDELQQMIKKDIAGLRSDMEKLDAEQRQLLKQLEGNTAFTEEFQPYAMPVILQNKISKYDYQSLALAIFAYREAKINFLKQTQLVANNPDAQAPILKKARYYQELTEAKSKLDELNKDIISKINNLNTQKHSKLINSYFKGETGLTAFTKEEQQKNDKLFSLAIANLGNSVVKTENDPYQNAATATYKTETISLALQPEALQNGNPGYNVKAIKTLANGSYFITGSFVSNTAPVAFAALATADNKVVWLKTIDIDAATFADCGMVAEVSESNLFVMVSSVNAADPTQIKNTLVQYDMAGKETVRSGVTATQLARYMTYDEINDNLLTAFHGQTEAETESQICHVIQSDAKATQKWAAVIPMKGNLIDIVRMNDKFLVFANTKKDASPQVVSTLLDSEGKIEKTISYAANKAYFGLKVIKLNSNQINLVGQYGDFAAKGNFTASDKNYYLLTDALGNQVFSKAE